ELALKARLMLDRIEPPSTHNYSNLFRRLSARTRTDVAHRLTRGNRGASAQEFTELLEQFGNPFEDWRYVHERLANLQPTAFDSTGILAAIHAVHDSIVELR